MWALLSAKCKCLLQEEQLSVISTRNPPLPNPAQLDASVVQRPGMRAARGCLLAQRWEPRTPGNARRPRCGLRGTCLCNLVPLLLTLSSAQAPASPGAPDLLQDTSGREVCFSGGECGRPPWQDPGLSCPPEVTARFERPALLGRVPSRHCCDASFAECARRALACEHARESRQAEVGLPAGSPRFGIVSAWQRCLLPGTGDRNPFSRTHAAHRSALP